MAMQELRNLDVLDPATGEVVEVDNLPGHTQALSRLHARRSRSAGSGLTTSDEALIVAVKEDLNDLYVAEKKARVRPRQFEETELRTGLPQDIINQIYEYLTDADKSGINLEGIDQTYGDAANIEDLFQLDGALSDAWNYYATLEENATKFGFGREDARQLSALGRKVNALLLKREDLLARGMTLNKEEPKRGTIFSRFVSKIRS